MNSKILYTIKTGLALSFLLLVSCEDYFLDTKPVEFIKDELSITDQKSADAALAGAYDKLQNSEYYGGAGFQGNIFLAGGDAIWTGTWDYLYSFVTHSYRADNKALFDSWLAIYSTINQANHVIKKVPDLNTPGLTEEKKNVYVGEALYIRALAYFDLARTWGNVPIVLEPTTSGRDFAGIKQSSQADVFKHVLSDLDKAAQLLPNTLNRNRATLRTVQALKARVYLYNKEWEKAEENASILIQNTDYQLIDWPTFLKNVNTKESIFELAFSTSDKSANYGQWTNTISRGQWQPNREIYLLLTSPATGGSRSNLVKDASTPTKLDYYIQQVWWRTTGENPSYILRIAEQYLIRAEARVKKTVPDLAGALKDLNAVRLRSQVAPSTAITSEEILKAIEDERRIEFALEPHRWFDLVRTERADDVLGVTDSRKWIFPIPYNDIKTDNDLVQNPGYSSQD